MFVVMKTRNRWGRSITIWMLLLRYVVDVSFCLFLVCFCYVFYSVYGLYYFCLWPIFLLFMANISSVYGQYFFCLWPIFLLIMAYGSDM